MAPGGPGVYVVDMASVKKGILTPAGEWWKHLRWTKRAFWKGERQAGKPRSQEGSRERLNTAQRSRFATTISSTAPRISEHFRPVRVS